MNPNEIEDNEILYRVVRKSNPDGFIDEKPSPALFIDSNGASVDRDGERSEAEIVETFKNRFQRRDDYKTAVKIGAKECREIQTYPNPIGNKKNIYHAEIWDSEDEREISLLKAIKLANLCSEVEGK